MIESVLKFFGIWAPSAQKVVRVVPAYHAAVSPAVLLLVIVAVVAGVVWLYRREEGEFTTFRRIAMAACRIIMLLLLMAILLRPVLSVTVGTSVRETMAVVVDTSASMAIADVRDQDADKVRAGIALGSADARGGLSQSGVSDQPARLVLAQAALKNSRINLLNRMAKEFDLTPYTFDKQLNDVAAGEGKTADGKWLDDLKADGPATALGDAIRNVLVAKRGQALGGILVITDGASNVGSSLSAAAQAAHEENVPVYAYGVGITSPKDVVVSTILGPEVAFVRDELPLTVRISSMGMAGQRGDLVLKMDGAPVDTRSVNFDKDGEQIIAMKFTPTKIGDFTLEATIAPRPDEVVKDNNTSAPKHLRVVDGRIKVLHIEQTPRWEFKYLQVMLMRDRRVDYHCWLTEADPGVTAEFAGRQSPYLDGFPARKEDLFKYDLVIFGDVDPRKLPAGAMEELNTFVSNFGGGFLMIAGKIASPQAYRLTPIEKMLPVELDLSPTTLARPSDTPIHLELTPEGKASTMLKIAPSEIDSARQWEQLPPIYWTARVARAKPAAQVLVVDADPSKATRFGKMPVVALQQYGLGQVLYVGTDNTWRWRKNLTESVFSKVWSQMVERMALAHMLGLAKRTQLTMDKEKYATGDRVTVYARLYRERDFEPIIDPTLKGYFALKGPAQSPHEVMLRAVPDQPGMYRAEFVAPAAGTYQFKSQTDDQTAVDFLVTEPRVELGETALAEGALKELAQKTGGVYVREEDLYGLPDKMRHVAQPLLSNYDVEIWSSPAVFCAVLIVAGVEWFLRKRAQLK